MITRSAAPVACATPERSACSPYGEAVNATPTARRSPPAKPCGITAIGHCAPERGRRDRPSANRCGGPTRFAIASASTQHSGAPPSRLLLLIQGEAFYANWDRAARETAAILRSAAGRDAYDRDLSDLVGELATQSAAFRTHWAAHNVRFHATAVKQLHHPAVGDFSLSFNRFDIAADASLTLFTYAAEPGTRSAEALNLLGSWAATADLAEPVTTTDQA